MISCDCVILALRGIPWDSSWGSRYHPIHVNGNNNLLRDAFPSDLKKNFNRKILSLADMRMMTAVKLIPFSFPISHDKAGRNTQSKKALRPLICIQSHAFSRRTTSLHLLIGNANDFSFRIKSHKFDSVICLLEFSAKHLSGIFSEMGSVCSNFKT